VQARGARSTDPASEVASSALRPGDLVLVEAGDESIPGDGDVILFGIASVDESAITGESAPVIRESGGDRSAVTGGTRVLVRRASWCKHRRRSLVPPSSTA
jgi:K+-transporting ATPase ATPase B chain